MSRAEMGKSELAIPLDLGWLGHQSGHSVPHISVCVCSYRSPRLLKRLLLKLNNQATEGLFTYSIVVADNDEERSGGPVVAKMSSHFKVPIRYCVEPRRNIALARNKAVENAEGAYVALIDEDEFPESTWLLTLYQTLCEYRVDGVLGIVRWHFEEIPPAWFRKSGIYSRKINPTGAVVRWRESRTGNALLKRGMLICDPAPFRPDSRATEDQDFFRRKIEAGYKFIWSADAVVCGGSAVGCEVLATAVGFAVELSFTASVLADLFCSWAMSSSGMMSASITLSDDLLRSWLRSRRTVS